MPKTKWDGADDPRLIISMKSTESDRIFSYQPELTEILLEDKCHRGLI